MPAPARSSVIAPSYGFDRGPPSGSAIASIEQPRRRPRPGQRGISPEIPRLAPAPRPEESPAMRRTLLLTGLVCLTAAGLTRAWWVGGHARIAEAASSGLPDD